MNSAKIMVDLLGLKTAPIAIAFLDAPPANVSHVNAPAPSSCSYWKQAADGEIFYTEGADQLNCPIGAYTHGVDLPPAQQAELQGVVGTMVSLGYLRMAEVPGIPKRTARFGVAVYAPLERTPVEPDVVLVCGNARQIMLLEEAAHTAEVGGSAALMGRPTCAALPAAMQSQHGVASLGCIGNRVYTQMADDELYYALPGKQVGVVVQKLAEIVNANRELEKYHRGRVTV